MHFPAIPRPKRYNLTALVLSLGGLLNGFDTGSIGATTSMPQFLASMHYYPTTTTTDTQQPSLPPSIHGLTVSTIILTSILPSILAGPLADRLGRLTLILPGAFLFLLGAAIQGSAHGLPQFIAGRAVAGVGQGLFFGNMCVYITEIAPTRRRGALASLPQFMATTGVCLGYFTCYGTANAAGSWAWRAPYVVQGLVALGLLVACLVVPESPRWLLLHHDNNNNRRQRRQGADGGGDGGDGERREMMMREEQEEEERKAVVMKALRWLEFEMDEARRDFFFLEREGEGGGAADSPPGPPAMCAAVVRQQGTRIGMLQQFVLLFRSGYRYRTLLALLFLGAVQLAGIDAITYYAPTLFSQAGITENKSTFLASGVSSITMLVVSIPAFLLTDQWNRRTSAITGGLGLAGLMFLIGALYAAGAVNVVGAARWVVVVSVFLFGMVYCSTWGIVGKVYASEIQPGNTRAAANSAAMGLNFFANWLVAFITPLLLAASSSGAYFLFGGLTLAATITLLLYMPETRGRSLEDIQTSFSRPKVSEIIPRYFSVVRRGRESATTTGSTFAPHANFELAPRATIPTHLS